MEEKIYTAQEAWKLLKIGRTRFYQLLKCGKIGYYKNGNRYLIPQSAIEKFISDQMSQYTEGGYIFIHMMRLSVTVGLTS